MKEHYSTSKTIVARTFKRLDFLGVDGTALFTNILLKKVIKHAKYIFIKAYILENLPVFKH